MKNLLGVLVCLFIFVHHAHASSLSFLDEKGSPRSPAEICGSHGAALCVIKAFPGAMEEAARSLSRLPASLRRHLPIRLVFAGTTLRRARLWCKSHRFTDSWLCDPKNAAQEGFAIRSFPKWLFLDESGRVRSRASLLPPRELERVLRKQLKRRITPSTP